MDRPLQERVIGAIVLVVVAVLMVPVFLDGPAPESEVVVQGVTLPGQAGRQPATQKIVLSRDRTEPVPATRLAADTGPGPDRDESTKASGSSATADATARQESPAEPAPTTGMWAVQLGSFADRGNAERLAAQLREEGYAAFLSKGNSAAGSLHRVRIGPQKDRKSAESVAAQLKKSGHTGKVMRHL